MFLFVYFKYRTNIYYNYVFIFITINYTTTPFYNNIWSAKYIIHFKYNIILINLLSYENKL